MSFSLNLALLTGNITKQPELKYTNGGMAFCRFGLATNRSQKNQDGSYTDIPTFHNVVVWGKMAEHISKTYGKGTLMQVIGRIDNRTYKDQQGVDRYISEVVANQVIPMQRQDKGVVQPQVAQPTYIPAPANNPVAAAPQPPAQKPYDPTPSGVEGMSVTDVENVFAPDAPADAGQGPFPWDTPSGV